MTRTVAMDLICDVERPAATGCDGDLACMVGLEVPCNIRKLGVFLERCSSKRPCTVFVSAGTSSLKKSMPLTYMLDSVIVER